MQRNEKQEVVDALHKKLSTAEFAVAVAYKDIDAENTVKLRKTFRESKIEYKVVKNTLAKLAAKGTPAEKLSEKLTGPSAFIIGFGDVVSPAKVLQDVLKEQGDKLSIKGGIIQGNLVDAAGLKALASLPGLQELRGMLAGMIATPATSLVRLLNTPASQLAQVLKAHAEKGEKAA